MKMKLFLGARAGKGDSGVLSLVCAAFLESRAAMACVDGLRFAHCRSLLGFLTGQNLNDREIKRLPIPCMCLILHRRQGSDSLGKVHCIGQTQ
jgi:hypothetical protein